MSLDRKKIQDLCRSYLAAMEHSDLEALLENFTDDATATSPISGKQSAREFYSYVMRVTSGRSMALRTIFIGTGERPRAAVQIAYTRRVGTSEAATIEAVDVFDLTEDCSKIESVTIIYDTAPVRSDFDSQETRHS
ncbi:MAG: nuclear transport factor 2 family protein [Pseudomonadota bacterium]